MILVELILFFIIMFVGHGLMMFMMPGMHGGHEKKTGSWWELFRGFRTIKNREQRIKRRTAYNKI